MKKATCDVCSTSPSSKAYRSFAKVVGTYSTVTEELKALWRCTDCGTVVCQAEWENDGEGTK